MLDRTFITVLHRNTTRRSRFAHQNLPDQRQARCGLAETAVPTDLRKQRFESPPTPPKLLQQHHSLGFEVLSRRELIDVNAARQH